MTRVLPEPAPASTRHGPPRWWTASSWAGLRDGGGDDTKADALRKGRAMIARPAPSALRLWKHLASSRVACDAESPLRIHRLQAHAQALCLPDHEEVARATSRSHPALFAAHAQR